MRSDTAKEPPGERARSSHVTKRCDWCRKRLRKDYPLLICSDCCEKLGEMLSR
jgi:hypothetical protein